MSEKHAFKAGSQGPSEQASGELLAEVFTHNYQNTRDHEKQPPGPHAAESGHGYKPEVFAAAYHAAKPPSNWAVRRSFNEGHGEKFSPQTLAAKGVFIHRPLEGDSAHGRPGKVQFIVMHSTETKYPADAKRVIDSWNNQSGKHHKGAQFVVDRDGSIYMTANPDKWTVHVNNRHHKYDVTNQNSIGIEIVHSGDQHYTQKQYVAVQRLVEYLQDRYKVERNHIVTHREIQPANRKDPVAFNVPKFKRDLVAFHQDKKPRSVIV